MKSIILISPFPPAQNPRLLKEYHSLKATGYNVKVWYAERDKWAANYKDNKNTDFVLIGGSYGSIFYYFTRLLHKTLKNIFPKTLGYNRVSWLLYFKALRNKADLFIAHNSAALPIAVKGAQWHKTKCGFDAEDFHRQEITDNQESQQYKTIKYLEDKYFPKLNYITAASPLIAAEYKKVYPNLNPVVINNVFSLNFLVPTKPNKGNETLNLFWFSQTIGKNRGLEVAIKAIGLLNNAKINLTLLGMISPIDKAYFEDFAKDNKLSSKQLVFLAPVTPDDVFGIASQYDIGLALELNTPFNRDICLTNKIFTYVTSGLAIIATQTTAQKQFLETYPLVGQSFPIGDVNKLSKIINYYYHSPNELLKTKLAVIQLAKNKLNWEQESEKFIDVIKHLLK